MAFSRSFSRGRAPFGQRFLVLTKRSAASGDENGLLGNSPFSREPLLKAETHDGTNRVDTSPRLHCCCDKSLALSLSLRCVARLQTSLNLCDRSQRRNSVAATMIFTCHTRRFVAATCRGDVSQRFVASCVSAFRISRNVARKYFGK